jgi:Trm5-related predicted tRNA methylase
MSAVFSSGAKSSEEKPRYDLIPLEAQRREAVRMAEGARSHGENNYRKGAADPAFVRDRINHAIEHLLKYADGDRTEDHLAAVRCNCGMLIWLESATDTRVL